jgi:hypothetical protein
LCLYDSSQSIIGSGFVSTYQHFAAKKPGGEPSVELKNAVHGSGLYIYESLARMKQRYYNLTYYGDAGEKLDQDTSDEEVVELDEEAAMVYGEKNISLGLSFKADPIRSPWKDGTWAKNYKNYISEVSMSYLFDDATTLNSKATTVLRHNCDYKNYAKMEIVSDFNGTAHFGMLQEGDKHFASDRDFTTSWKNPALEMDEDYRGVYHIDRKMVHEVPYERIQEDQGWLPCCNGGFFEMLMLDPAYHSAEKIFNSSLQGC